jgi:hypothetical protein
MERLNETSPAAKRFDQKKFTELDSNVRQNRRGFVHQRSIFQTQRFFRVIPE